MFGGLETAIAVSQRKVSMAQAELVKVSESADTALNEFDFAAQGGRNSIRLFIQGYG